MDFKTSKFLAVSRPSMQTLIFKIKNKMVKKYNFFFTEVKKETEKFVLKEVKIVQLNEINKSKTICYHTKYISKSLK